MAGAVKRKRSPGYPVIDLKEAVIRAKKLWDKDKYHPIPKQIACKQLGYGSTGGYAGRVLSALKQFGLILEKHGDIVLTQYAKDLALYSPSDAEYVGIIKKIALKPDIYAKIYTQYGGQIPSDDILRIKLVKDYDFNIEKVSRFINTFHDTINFAGLSGLEGLHECDVDEKDVCQEGSEGRLLNISGSMEAKSSVKGNMTVSNKVNRHSYPLPSGGITIIFDKLPVKKEALQKLKQWIDLYEEDLTEVEEVNIQSTADQCGD